MAPIGYQTKIMSFSACHRLHSIHLNDDENAELYGKCNNFYGHGHNYTVEVTLRGSVDPKTGMILNLTHLKDQMQKAFMNTLDHKNLDKDVDYFKDKPSTTENVAVYVWEQMKNYMERPELLYEVKIRETDSNVVYYRGEQQIQ